MTNDPSHCARNHLRFGWWSLLVFLTLGMILEGLHGLKVGFYLDADHQTRRLMWTLGHAHGTLLSLINLAFAGTVRAMPSWPARRRALASRSLYGATLLLPGGFLLGGAWIHDGDPGLGVLLVPVGGLLLLVSVLLTAMSTRHWGG